MNILQIVPTYEQNCGIAIFARDLHEQLEKLGFRLVTSSGVNGEMLSEETDGILVHYHADWLNYNTIKSLCTSSGRPVVLFAHSDSLGPFPNEVVGIVEMCAGMAQVTDMPKYRFPLPAWVPETLEDRKKLRVQFGLPIKPMIIGTNGFLKFERQFVEILTELLPHAKHNDWFLNLITSPWYIDSPGLVTELEKLQGTYSGCFKFEYSFLDKEILNQKLQACDLLWCWTKAPSSPYASGVISDQYASGTRIFASDKLQHKHVLRLPNVVRAPNKLEPFIEQLILEIQLHNRQRHDPSPVSWDKQISNFAFFLTRSFSGRKKK